MKTQNSAAVLGTLVADSASLGLHWITIPPVLQRLRPSKDSCFFSRMLTIIPG